MTTTPPTSTRDIEGTGALPPELVRVVVVASFGPILLNLGSTSINVALPSLMTHFDVPLSTIQWVTTGYLLALASVLPAFRFAVERLGSRRLYVGCLIAFTATSALSAVAWSATSLIALRVLQGAVGGLLAPLAQLLCAQLAGPKRMGHAISFISIPALVAPLLGPIVGGLIVEHLSWRWLFFLNAPLGLLGAWLATRRLPPGKTDTRANLDLRGLALLSPGIAAFTFAVSALGRAHGLSATVLAPMVIALALLTAFVLDARRRPETALLDLRVVRHPVVGAALATYLLASFGSFGGQLLLPLFYQKVRGASASDAGLLMIPQGVGMLLSLPQVGKLTDRFDNGAIVIGGALTTLAGTAAFTVATEQTSIVLLSASLVVRGIGLGAIAAPALSAAYRALSRDEIPNATTALNIVQRLGAPLGTAIMAMTLQRFIDHTPGSLAPAFAHTFLINAAFSALSVFAGLVLLRAGRGGRAKGEIRD